MLLRSLTSPQSARYRREESKFCEARDGARPDV